MNVIDVLGEDYTGRIYNGNIVLSAKNLTSLEGSPEIVYGNFDCSHNRLKSLKGAPREVYGDFLCMFNMLSSLKGSLMYVHGVMNCSNNNLESLSGDILAVTKNFFCNNNNLKTLKDSPKLISNYVTFNNNPNLSSLDGLDLSEIKNLSIIDTKISITEALRYILESKDKIKLVKISYGRNRSQKDFMAKNFLDLDQKEKIIYIFENFKDIL